MEPLLLVIANKCDQFCIVVCTQRHPWLPLLIVMQKAVLVSENAFRVLQKKSK